MNEELRKSAFGYPDSEELKQFLASQEPARIIEMKPSENVLKELRHLKEEWEAGIDEGYSQNPNILPDFFDKPYKHMTARQRGYIFGRELRLHDKEVTA